MQSLIEQKTVFIYSACANSWKVEEGAPVLKTLVKDLWGKGYRRISHFIELALVGSKRCIDQSKVEVSPQCDVVFTTGQGNISQVIKVTKGIFVDKQPPMPFDFMHITNNMAGFYVAQALGLNSSNLTVSHRAFPFETAIDLALLQIKTHVQNEQQGQQFLLGAVDECAFPLSQHRQRLQLADNVPLAEGSHWLLLGNNPEQAIAKILFCEFYSSQGELLQSLKQRDLAPDFFLSCGYGIEPEETPLLKQQLGSENYYIYVQDTAYHDTAAAYGISSFIEKHNNQTIVHINKSRQNRYCVLGIEVL